MGESFNAIHQLEPPFAFVDERVIFIPRGRRLEVNNNELKFILFFEGETDLLIDGQRVGRVRKGDLLIVPRRCQQVYVPLGRTEERLHTMRLFLDPEALRRVIDAGVEPPPGFDPEKDFPAFLRKTFKSVRIISGALSGRLRDWVQGIREESEQRGPGHRFRASAFCRLLVTDVAGMLTAGDAPTATPAAAPADEPSSWVIEHTKQFLFENHARALTLGEIAWEVKLSGEHLCRRFKEETGITVFAYLRHLRVEAAKGLLISSKLTVSEIATRSGFGSSSILCRTFQKATRRTPIEFRRDYATRIHFQRTSLQSDARIF